MHRFVVIALLIGLLPSCRDWRERLGGKPRNPFVGEWQVSTQPGASSVAFTLRCSEHECTTSNLRGEELASGPYTWTPPPLGTIRFAATKDSRNAPGWTTVGTYEIVEDGLVLTPEPTPEAVSLRSYLTKKR